MRALPLEELRGLFQATGLPEPRATGYRLEADLEGLLERSFPRPEDVPEIRRIFEASLADDGLGLATRRAGDRIRLGYPVAVLAAAR